jgi:16S rRNA (guanine(966)-N(2))-methyltransferase RsmD
MVREAVFNMLQGQCSNSMVLDLFAGSGAMGLEALSRGAAEAVFCDNRFQAFQVIRDNVQLLNLERQTVIFMLDWSQALKRLGAQRRRFDLIFLDPPYKMEVNQILSGIEQEQLLKDEGVLVLEQGADMKLNLSDTYELVKDRRYGDTRLHLIQHRSIAK